MNFPSCIGRTMNERPSEQANGLVQGMVTLGHGLSERIDALCIQPSVEVDEENGACRKVVVNDRLGDASPLSEMPERQAISAVLSNDQTRGIQQLLTPLGFWQPR